MINLIGIKEMLEMVNFTNKTIAFVLCAFLTILSWFIVILNVILRLTTFFAIGLYSVDTVGFILVTLLLTMYTVFILFKISNIAYFPIILILFHMATLNGSTLAIFFIIIDLIVLILLNTSKSNSNDNDFSNTNKSYYDSNNNNSNNKNNHINDDNVFDAEYKTK
jgi:hypothetical protein